MRLSQVAGPIMTPALGRGTGLSELNLCSAHKEEEDGQLVGQRLCGEASRSQGGSSHRGKPEASRDQRLPWRDLKRRVSFWS